MDETEAPLSEEEEAPQTWDFKLTKIQQLIRGIKDSMDLDEEESVDPFKELRRQRLAPKPLQNKPFEVRVDSFIWLSLLQ